MCRIFKIIFMLALLICTVSSVSVEAAKKVVAVMPIESASDNTAKEIANIMENQLTRALLDSSTYTVVERNQLNHALKEIGFQMTGAVDPNQSVEVGKMLGVQYSVISKVTVAELKNNKSSLILGALLELGTGQPVNKTAKYVAKIAVDIKFIDNETGEIVLVTQVNGEKGGDTSESVLNEVCKIAADDFLDQLKKKNPFSAAVLDVDGDVAYIEAGTEAGLREGEILGIYKEGVPIKNMEGKIIAVKSTFLGKMQVQSVNEGYSICRIIERIRSEIISRGALVKRI